ncbi:MAG: RIP metalloprotease RseP [Chloroflexota bacterium]|nr:RIP metalloprotease RseP [Chloroflexota bacterium]MDE2946283.1 RIP metalloprotease RseP [Chloroflexota bacterium]
MLVSAAANDILLAIAAFALVLLPAVIIHELGHFIAARFVGINVLEFGIGFPPRVGRLFMLGETEFTLNWLPLGGFVRPLGEDMIGPASEDKVKRDRVNLERRRSGFVRVVSEREMLQLRGVDERKMMSVNEAPALGRIFFMSAGAIANFILALFLFFLVALIGLSLPVGGLSQIAAIPPGSMFYGSAAQAGDAIERINGERFADFAEFHEKLSAYQRDAIEFSLIRQENGEEYSLTVKPDFAERSGLVQVMRVLEGSPAEAAGIQAGDIIAEINHSPIPPSGDAAKTLLDATREFAGRPLPLTLNRERGDGSVERIAVIVSPRENPPEGEGRLGLGIRSQFGLRDRTRFANAGFKRELIPQSIPDALSYSLRTTAETFKLIASIPGRLLDGSLSGRDARPISIIGISKIGGELLQRSLQEGPGLMLNFIALISIFLGISNLLPIPALDGGRIVFVVIELLRGKPIDARTEARIHQLGIMLLLALGLVIMIYDLVNPPSIS